MPPLLFDTRKNINKVIYGFVIFSFDDDIQSFGNLEYVIISDQNKLEMKNDSHRLRGRGREEDPTLAASQHSVPGRGAEWINVNAGP